MSFANATTRAALSTHTRARPRHHALTLVELTIMSFANATTRAALSTGSCPEMTCNSKVRFGRYWFRVWRGDTSQKGLDRDRSGRSCQ